MYRIYYGTSANRLTEVITVPDELTMSYVVTGLRPGNYYFAISEFNEDGIEGRESAVAGVLSGKYNREWRCQSVSLE